MNDNVYGFRFLNGFEAIGVLLEEPSDENKNHYIIEDIIGVVSEFKNDGNVGMRFVPFSMIAETSSSNPLIISRIPIPQTSIMCKYPVKQVVLSNYITVRSNIMLPNVANVQRFS